MLDDLLAGRRADYHVEKRYRRKDGMVIWVRVSPAQAPEPGSSLRGIPTAIEDITERKRAEDALQEARDALLRVSPPSRRWASYPRRLPTKSISRSAQSWQTAPPA